MQELCLTSTIRGRLIIVCGQPASGKTTDRRNLATENGAVRYCPDELLADLGANLWGEQLREKVEALQWKQTKELLAVGVTTIIELGT